MQFKKSIMNKDQLLDTVPVNEKDNREEVIQLLKKITIIQRHLIYLKYAIIILKLKYDEEIAQEVRDLGYDLPKMEDGVYFMKNRNYAYDTALLKIETLADEKFPELNDLINQYNLIKLPE